jgi:hypothetical protein
MRENFREPNSRSASQEIPFYETGFRVCSRTPQPHGSLLGAQGTRVIQDPPPFFGEIHFNVILPSMLPLHVSYFGTSKQKQISTTLSTGKGKAVHVLN